MRLFIPLRAAGMECLIRPTALSALYPAQNQHGVFPAEAHTSSIEEQAGRRACTSWC
jgi:hypothetical protein